MKNHAKFFALFFLALFAFSLSAFSQTPAPPAKPAADSKPHVRTVTAFINLDRTQYQLQFAETAKFLGYAKTVFESRGYTVETLRVVTQPFPEYTKGMSPDDALRFFKNLDGLADQYHVSLAIGSAYLSGTEETPRPSSSPRSCKTRKRYLAAWPSPTTPASTGPPSTPLPA